MKSVLFSLGCVLVLMAAKVTAQDVWTPVSGPLKPYHVWAISAPGNGQIYCGTDTGVFRSSDNGNSWTQCNNGLMSLKTGCLKARTNGFALVAADTFVFVTNDYGATWTLSNDGLSGKRVLEFVLLRNGAILANAGFNGLYRSTTNGSSWVKDSSAFGSMSIDHIANNFGSEVVIRAEQGSGRALFVSKDDGRSWAKIDSSGSWWSYWLCVTSNGRIYADDVGSIMYSDDDGASWTYEDNWSYEPYVMVDDPNDALYGSHDDGLWIGSTKASSGAWHPLTWQPEAFGMTVTPQGALICGETIARSDWSEAAEFCKSTDAGTTWMHRSYMTADPNGLVPSVKSLVSNQQGEVFASTEYGAVLHSKDGLVWSAIRNGWPTTSASPHSIAVDRQNNVLASSDSGLFKLEENSSKWLKILESPVTALAVDSDNAYYAFSTVLDKSQWGYEIRHSNWFRSTNGGVTWDSMYSSDSTFNVAAASKNGFLYAVNRLALFRSSDFGRSWKTIHTAYFRGGYWDDIGDIVVNQKDDVFILDSGSVIRSTDNGDSWTNYSGKPTNWWFVTLALGPDGTLFGSQSVVSYVYPAIYKTVHSTSDVESLSQEGPKVELSTFPNPMVGSTTLHFSLPRSGYVSLALYDINGRDVLHIANSQMDAGEHDILVERGELRIGVYYCLLRTPQGSTTEAVIVR